MKIIGHRGSAGIAPENTIAACLKALKYGADMIELDVRVSADHIAVLHHDPNVTDASGAICRIRTHTFAELRTHKPDLATLSEALQITEHRVPVIIEIKPEEPVAPVITVIRRHLAQGWHATDTMIASFSQTILREVQRALPDITVIVNERWSGLRATYRARQLNTRFITMNKRWLWSGFIRSMHTRGYYLSAYTLNDPKKSRTWAQWGLYGVVTDFPDRFRTLPNKPR